MRGSPELLNRAPSAPRVPMADQCGLCLCCGAPFLPIDEEMVNYDKLGNISVFFFQRTVRRFPQSKVKSPTFTGKMHESHIIHESHHAPALHFMLEQAKDGMPKDFVLKYSKNPKGKSPVRQVARWADDTDFRVNLLSLKKRVLAIDFNDRYTINLGLTQKCCHPCNTVMTMRFWYEYHL